VTTATAFQGEFGLRGTEPFWEGSIRGATIVVQFVSAAEEAPDSVYPGARLTVTEGAATWTATRDSDTLVVTMRKAPCEDGMSEELYPFRVTLPRGVTGCGYPSWSEEPRDLRASPPFDSVRAVSPPSDSLVTCQVHARRNVVVRAVEGEVGSALFVRSSGNRRCDAVQLPGDFVLRSAAAASYFLGLRGDVLFVDEGTGAEARRLILFDLRTRRRLMAVAYLELDRDFDAGAVRFWRAYPLESPAPGCDAPPGAAGVDSLFAADLASGATRFAGRTRCAVRE
jgi:uncharacterized membrane protein